MIQELGYCNGIENYSDIDGKKAWRSSAYPAGLFSKIIC
jgi:excinuclease UvrABC helicase subunit UvrB